MDLCLEPHYHSRQVEGQLQALQPGGFKEIAASYAAMMALTEAELGDYGEARRYAASSAALSGSRTVLPLLTIGGESDASGKTVVYEGKYLTVWKKQADGSRKVLYDVFNSDLPPTP